MISSYETPGSSPVPRRIARSMFSRGMLLALASAMIVRSRGFMSGSPPPARAATVSSLMIRVKILPRFASAAPFLCLIVCHFEWPDMRRLPGKTRENDHLRYHMSGAPPGQDDPDVGPLVPRRALIIAEHGVDVEARVLQPAAHLRHRERPEGQREPVHAPARAAPLDVFLIEARQAAAAIL